MTNEESARITKPFELSSPKLGTEPRKGERTVTNERMFVKRNFLSWGSMRKKGK